jgi:hypothetical protein
MIQRCFADIGGYVFEFNHNRENVFDHFVIFHSFGEETNALARPLLRTWPLKYWLCLGNAPAMLVRKLLSTGYWDGGGGREEPGLPLDHTSKLRKKGWTRFHQ